LLRATLAFPPGERSSLDWSRTLEIFMEKVQSFGGRVEEVSPTGIVAAFGLEPVEDAPRRAVHVAMAIQKAAERVRPDGAEKLAVKIGIHVGQFLVGQVSGALEIDLDTKREAWTTLEALVDRAELDAILVSAAAAPFIERRFDLAQVGTSERAPEPAYRLVGHERTGFGGRVTRFVGRADELQLLRSRLASAMRGHGQVVGIVGEAGIGKSRLLLEFRQSLVGEPVIYREGRCLSYGSGIPYLPVLEMLRSNFRLSETDTPEAMAEKVRWSLDTIGIDAEAAAPYLLHLLGVKEGTERLAELSPETIQARTFESLRQMSLKGSRQRPLIMAVEDLHWIDSASEEYFASLVGSLAGTPILLLFTYRPGYRPSWIEKSNATQIALQPLSPEESLTVLQSALPAEQIPDPLAQLILAKAEGNPFFLEELARTLGEQGDLRATFAVPDTIQGVLLARIDRLPAEPKQLLQTASVLGREFSQRLLGALLEGPGALAPQLRELMRQEFLYERSGAEEPVYVFKHALTQEVVYESLLSPSRQALHAAAGRALEALYAGRLEEVYDSLAYHYSKTEEAAKAVEYLTRFARKTARNHAHVESVMALQEALAHVERLPEEARDRLLLDLVLRQVQSLNFLGRNQESLDLLIQQQERVKRRQDPSQAAPYYFSLGLNYSLLGDQWRAVQSLKRALQEAQRGGDERTMGRAHALLTLENCWSGHVLEGIEHGRQAVALLERTQQRYWLALTHFYVAITYYLIGEVEPALEAAARAQAIGEAIAHPVIQSNAASITGLIYALAGERAAGIEACQRGLELSPDPLTTATALGFLGYAYLEKGDADQAIPLLEQAAKQKAQFRYQQSWFTTLLGEAFLLSGQIVKARDLVLRGLELTRDVEYRYGVGWAQRTLGRIAQARGTFSEAETHFQEALQTFALIQSRFEVARTRLDLAKLAHAQGNHQAAATHLKETYHAFKALRVPRRVEHTRQLAGELGVSLSEEPA
jgi:tetratricopeptide (TPR) repeat protein